MRRREGVNCDYGSHGVVAVAVLPRLMTAPSCGRATGPSPLGVPHHTEEVVGLHEFTLIGGLDRDHHIPAPQFRPVVPTPSQPSGASGRRRGQFRSSTDRRSRHGGSGRPQSTSSLEGRRDPGALPRRSSLTCRHCRRRHRSRPGSSALRSLDPPRIPSVPSDRLHPRPVPSFRPGDPGVIEESSYWAIASAAIRHGLVLVDHVVVVANGEHSS